MKRHPPRDTPPGPAKGRPGCVRVLFAALVVWWLPLTRSLAQAPASMEQAQRLFTAGHLREAVEVFRQVATASQAADPATAGAAYNNACYLLFELGSYHHALKECDSALRLRRELDDEPQLARTLNNLGRVLQGLGSYAEATDRFQEALEINRRHGDKEAQAMCLGNLGMVCIATGDYSRALAFYTQVLELAEGDPQAPWAPAQRRIASINRGVVLEKLGAFREALAIYEELLSEANRIEPRHHVFLQVNMGVIYRNLGDSRRALAAFRQAITVYEQLGDRSGLSNAYLNLGLARHLNLGQLEAAEEAYREALRLAQATGDRSEEIQDLFYLGRLLLDLGRLEEARQAFERCRTLSEESGSAEGRWSALEGAGRVAAAGGDLHAALDLLASAMDEIERVRRSLVHSSLRAGYFGDKRSVYQAAVRVLVTLEMGEPGAGYGEQAFQVVQRAKARELIEALGTAGEAGQPLAVAQMRARLAEGILVEYFLGEKNLFAWTLTRRGLDTADLGPAAPVLEEVRLIHDALSQGREPETAVITDISTRLLAGLGPALARSPRLLVAPDGKLHYLPFEILDHPDSPGASLVDTVAVSYLPSASTLAPLGPKENRPTGGTLGFADPELPRHPAVAQSAADLLLGRFDPRGLPASTRELTAMGRWLAGKHEVRIGEEATEEAFREAAPDGLQVVHVASHTVVDEGLGRGAAILLTPTQTDDGLLYPEEIARLDYNVELTVLASCRTALGSEEGGRGLSSLTGALLRAGSRAVVATLWDVEDEATAAFMEQFYYQLGRGHPPVEALHRTKKRLRSDPAWNHTRLWAPYILIGETSGLVTVPLVPVWAWVLAAVLAAAWSLGHLGRKVVRRTRDKGVEAKGGRHGSSSLP